MMPEAQRLVSCVLLFALFGFAASSTVVAHTFDITLTDASVLTADAVFFRLLPFIQIFSNGFFDFLQHNFCMPSWIFWQLFACCIFPQVFTTIYDATLQVFRSGIEMFWNYHYNELHEQINNLQQEVNIRIHPSTVQNRHQVIEARNAALSDANNRAIGELLRKEDELKTSQDLATAREYKIDDLENKIEMIESLYNAKAVRTREEQHNRALRESQNEVIDLRKEKSELEDKLNRARRRITDEQWDYEAKTRFEHDYQVTIDEKQKAIDQQAAEIKHLRQEAGQKNGTIHLLNLQVNLFEKLKTVLFDMAGDSDDHQKASATFFVTALKNHGVDLVELGVDPQRHETYVIWARELIQTGSSCLSPSSGFKLEGFRGRSSGVYVSGNRTFESDKSDFDRIPLLGQSSWSPQTDSETDPVNPAPANVAYNDESPNDLSGEDSEDSSANHLPEEHDVSNPFDNTPSPASQQAHLPSTASEPSFPTPSPLANLATSSNAGSGTTNDSASAPNSGPGLSNKPVFGVPSGPPIGLLMGAGTFGATSSFGLSSSLGSTSASGSTSQSGSALIFGSTTTFGSTPALGSTSGSTSASGSAPASSPFGSGSGSTPSFGSGFNPTPPSTAPLTKFDAAASQLGPIPELFRHVCPHIHRGGPYKNHLGIDEHLYETPKAQKLFSHQVRFWLGIKRMLCNNRRPNHMRRPLRVAKKGSLNRSEGCMKSHGKPDLLRGICPRSRVIFSRTTNTRRRARNRR